MRNPADLGRIERAVGAVVGSVPSGYVTTHGDVAQHLGVDARLVVRTLAVLAGADGEVEGVPCPWWRVVADGGAVGRGRHREAQLARLSADGVPFSAAGIVQELAERRVRDLAAPPPAPFRRVEPKGPPRRSRGMKGHAGSA